MALVVGSFSTRAEVDDAIRRLEMAGIGGSDFSMELPDDDSRLADVRLLLESAGATRVRARL